MSDSVSDSTPNSASNRENERDDRPVALPLVVLPLNAQRYSCHGCGNCCRDFTVHSVTVGKDAQGEAMVQLEHEGQMYRGRAVSTDSIEASTMAFLSAINRIAAVANGVKAV